MFEEQPQVARPGKQKKNRRKTITIWAAVAIAVIALAVGGLLTYNYVQDQNDKINRLSDPQQAAKDEAAKVKDLVAQLADIPVDETPTVATVNDANKLKGQAFFANAENGDKVLIFTNAKKAYLYRPSTNKLIEVAPVNIGDTQTDQPQQ